VSFWALPISVFSPRQLPGWFPLTTPNHMLIRPSLSRSSFSSPVHDTEDCVAKFS
jgi:hypothetical protein